MDYKITFVWDNDAGVWIATSEDIPGLVLESGSIDALIERVKYAVPELIELNHLDLRSNYHFMLDRKEPLYS